MSIEENRVKHLEMIQSIVTRMNTNSFQVKGFSVTLTTGILAAFAATKIEWMFHIGYIPIIIFWIIDSYYLQNERKYRSLYNDIIVNPSSTKIAMFSLSVKGYNSGENHFLSAMIVSVNSFIYLSTLAYFIVFGVLINS